MLHSPTAKMSLICCVSEFFLVYLCAYMSEFKHWQHSIYILYFPTAKMSLICYVSDFFSCIYVCTCLSSNTGNTAQIYAAFSNSKDVFDLLCKYLFSCISVSADYLHTWIGGINGLTISVCTCLSSNTGNTAQIYAAFSNSKDVVDLLSK
jgi:N-acetylmuramoyl-L-alanine amidase CwlA